MSLTAHSAWRPIEGPGALRTMAARGDNLAAGLNDGRVLHSMDSGRTWMRLRASLPYPATSLLFDGGGIWAGTQAGLHYAPWEGRWRAVIGLPRTVITTLTRDHSLFIAGTLRAGLFRSEDGFKWEPVGYGLPFDGVGLHIHAAVITDRNVYVAHALGVSRSGDLGQSWTSNGVGLPLHIPRAVLLASGARLIAGISGSVYHTDLLSSGDTMLLWNEVWSAAGGVRPLIPLLTAEGWLFARIDQSPFLVRSNDHGQTWHDVTHGLPESPRCLVTSSAFLFAVLKGGSVWCLPMAEALLGKTPMSAPQHVHLNVHYGRVSEDSKVDFTLAEPGEVVLGIFDIMDHEVKRLGEGRFDAGAHSIPILAGTLEPGLYKCRLRVGRSNQSIAFVMVG